jgi:glycosyltransferase involved in cell wall biosynthesis
MKILFFNYEYPPLGGGAANATAYLLREYAKIPELKKVDLITSSVDGSFHQEKIGNKITIYKLPIGKNKNNLHFQSQKDLIIYTWKAYFFSKKLIKKNQYDLTHSFFGIPCGFISYLLKKQFKIPYIISLRGSDVPGYSDRFPLIYTLLTPLIKLIWKNAQSVVANSIKLKELALKTNSQQKIEIIYNGIDVDKFRPAQHRNTLKDKFIITPGASRITDRKGLKYLIEAVYSLSKKYPQIALKIMGEGNARDRLEKQVKELNIVSQVKFLGRIPREKTTKYYQEASVFVLPSLNEGMSNAMLEALASGLPLVATDTGGTQELVKEGKNGYFIKTKNVLDIVQKIEKLINDVDLREKMGEASRQKALTMSWSKVAQNYVALYRQIRDKN